LFRAELYSLPQPFRTSEIKLVGARRDFAEIEFGAFLRCSRLLNQQSNLISHILVLRACFPLNYLKLSYLHTAFAIILAGQTFQELSPRFFLQNV